MARSWLMVTRAGGGNVNPFLALAEHLLRRGHRVGAVATASVLPRLAAAGIEVVGAALPPDVAADEIAAAITLQLESPERMRIEPDPGRAVRLLEGLASG